MTEEEKEAIEEAKKQIEEAHNLNELNIFMTDSTTLKILLNYIEKLQKRVDELDKYKRLAESNLKDSQEFQDNMCNHRCIKNNEVLELKAEIEKKDKVIDLMAYQLFRYGYYVVKKYDVENESYIKSKTKEEIKEYFYKKVEKER